MAAGLPVAGYVAPGPKDLIPGSGAGHVNKDLRQAALDCADITAQAARDYAMKFSWRACAEQFIENLEPLPVPERKRFWSRFRRLRRRKNKDAV